MFQVRLVNTTESASTPQVHSCAIAPKASPDLGVKPTSTNANHTPARTKGPVWMILEHFDVSACQVSKQLFQLIIQTLSISNTNLYK